MAKNHMSISQVSAHRSAQNVYGLCTEIAWTVHRVSTAEGVLGYYLRRFGVLLKTLLGTIEDIFGYY